MACNIRASHFAGIFTAIASLALVAGIVVSILALAGSSAAVPITLDAGETLKVEWLINAPPAPMEVGAVQLVFFRLAGCGKTLSGCANRGI